MQAKGKKVLKITAIVLAALIVAGGIAVGIYFGVQSERCSGYVRDQSGAPMEGVSVTNGNQVVKTNADGYYVLDGWLKDRFVTVTIPSGYWAEDYYLEIGSEREGYDFTLEKQEEDLTEHTFLQVSDSEVGEDGVGEWIEHVKGAAQDSGAAFIMHTGDICYEAGLKSHINGMNSENMGLPVRYAIGNHDYVKWGRYAEDLFESTYGPVCYSFEVGNVHYIVTPIVHGADYIGRYTNADVWRWVKNDLANVDEGKKVVMFNHDYCTSDEDGFVAEYGAGKKLDLKEHGLIAWIYGHWHYNLMYKTESGVFNICTGQPQGGGIDSSVPAVRSVTIKGGELTSSQMYYYDFGGAAPQESDWTAALGGNGYFAEPIVSGDYVYAATADDGWPKQCAIVKVNASTGEVVWRYETRNSVRNSMFMTDGGKLLAQDITGTVYCLDANKAASDKKITADWVRDTRLSAVRNTGLNVIADGDKVYCGGAQKSVCLNLSDGALVWETENDRANSSPTRMIISGELLYVGSHWDELIAYDKNTGKRVWSNDGSGIRYRTSTPFIYEGGLYVTTSASILELDPQSGEVRRSAEIGGVNFDTASVPLISGGVMYQGTADSGVVAVELKTLKKLWRFETGGALVSSTPYTKPGSKQVQGGVIELNGYICFGGMDGVVYKLDKNGNGELVGKKELGSPVLSAPASHDGSIIVLDFSGNLSKISL